MRRLVTSALVATCVLAQAPARAAAQASAVASRFESWTPPPMATASARRDPMHWLLGDGSKDHRYVGFYVGAGVGVAFGVVMLGFCGDTDSGDGCSPFAYVLAPVLSGAVLGAFLALVGSAIPK
jgi:hypothetical protein